MDADFERDVAILWSMLLAIIADSEKRLAAHMALHNLTPPQFFVLKTLVEHDGRCPIGQIAREHHLTNATLTGLVNRLEALRPPLVMRERHESDRRSVVVVLTDTGKERYAAVQDDLLQQLRVVLRLISPEDRRDVIDKISHYVQVVMAYFPVESIESKRENNE